MPRIEYLLAINIFLFCSFSRTISPVYSLSRLIRAESTGECQRFTYTCDNKECIPEEKFCDGAKDCEDGSDEYNGCQDKRTCKNFEFRCDNGFCKYNNKRCDGIRDCSNNSDEANCDMKRCEYNGQLCGQICTDITNTTIECSCLPEYVLQNDKKTCRLSSNASDGLLVYSTKNSIGALQLPSRKEIELVTNLNDVLAVTVDASYVYWSVETLDHNAIYRSLRGKNQPQAIVTTGLAFIEEIAIDWVTSNIYFLDSSDRTFGVCTNNGSYCTIILRGRLTIPSGLTLDPFKGMMYWSDYGRRGGYIGKAKMDGNERGTLVSEDIGMPQAITIDVPNERLYWVDRLNNHIGSIRLDGTNRQRTASIEFMKIQSIAIFEDQLYWSDYDKMTIESFHKFTGENREILKRDINRLRGMHIYHELLKPNITNPCISSNCSELCLLAGPNTFTCACSLDKKLGTDGNTCESITGNEYLMVATNSIYFNYHGELIGRPSIKRNRLFRHFSAIAYDPLKSTFFVNDIYSSTISRFYRETGKIEPLKGVKNQQIGGLAFDHIGNNLYWSNIRRNTIEIYSIEKEQKATISLDMTPKNILVIPEFATMIMVLCTNSMGCQLYKAPMDAPQNATILVSTKLWGPQISLVYDKKSHRIFWADEATGQIQGTTIDGADPKVLQSGLLKPMSLSTLADNIYWTVYNKTTLFKSKLTKPHSLVYKVAISLANETEMIHLVLTNYHKDKSVHKCAIDNGGCSHVCLVTSMDSYQCACSNGFALNPDNHTCKQVNCTLNEYKCADNSCISNKKICDGIEDCPDFDDEEKCPMKSNNCSTNDFQCFNGNCLLENFICDGNNDCGDWSDEMNCAHRVCSDETNFKCLSSGRCIPNSWQCDGQQDCDDGSDESGNCKRQVCPDEMNPCSNGMCVHYTLHCNYVDECGDKSDELDCADHEPTNPSSYVHCDINQYRCFGTDVCIPKESRCDNHTDCPKGDDEYFCSTCSPDQFTCNNLNCLPIDNVCDEYNDCEDKSDEEFCDKDGIVQDEKNLSPRRYSDDSMISNSKFVCDNDKILDYGKLCDDHDDCNDFSDERGSCNETCPIDLCHHRCERTPQGPICLCMDGYKLKADKRTCEDIDECKLGICSQLCHNEEGSYRCDCFSGFSLRSDQKSCKVIDSTVGIISATAHDIRRIGHNFREVDVIYEMINNITGMDMNVRENLLYWSNEQLGTITEFNLTDKTQRNISNFGRPTVIAVDWITSNIYFANHENPLSVMACSRFNNTCVTIAKMLNADVITAMTIDPIHSSIYWAQTTFTSTDPISMIYRSKLDGDIIEVIAQGKIGIVSGIAIDYKRSLLFWTDTSQGFIMKSELDGSGRTVFRRVYQPLSINIYEDAVYWMMGSTRELYGCSIHDKLQCHPLDIVSSNVKNFLIISHKSQQPQMPNVCDKNNCEWMCVPKHENAKCVCRDGFGMNFNGTCSNDATNSTINNGDNNNSLVFLILIGIPVLFSVILVSYVYRENILRKLQSTLRNPSASYHSVTITQRELNNDAIQPIIDSGLQELANPLSNRDPSPSASHGSATEMVQLHLPGSHTVETAHSDKSNDETH